MKLKIGASTLAGDNLEKFLEKLANLKLEYVEIVKSYPNPKLDYELFESYDFKYTIHSPLIDMNISSLTESIRQASIQEVKNSIDDAVKVNTDTVVVHPGKISFAGQKYEKYVYNLCNQAFLEIKEYSKDTGVYPLIENMPLIKGFMYTDINQLTDTLKDLEMYMTLDVGHAYTAKFKENQLYNPLIKHIHIHDNNGDDDAHLPLGEGNIKFKEVFDKFTKENYKGIYIIEANNEDSLETSIKYLKNNKYI